MLILHKIFISATQVTSQLQICVELQIILVYNTFFTLLMFFWDKIGYRATLKYTAANMMFYTLHYSINKYIV